MADGEYRNPTDFIRLQPRTMTNQEVAKAANDVGFTTVTPSAVYQTRWRDKKRKKSAAPKTKRKAATTKATVNAKSEKPTVEVAAPAVRVEVARRAVRKEVEPNDEHVNEFLAMFSSRGEFALTTLLRRMVRRELRKLLGGV